MQHEFSQSHNPTAISRIEQSGLTIIQGDDGRFYQITEVGTEPAGVHPRALERMKRQAEDRRQAEATERFARFVFCVGAVFVGGFALLIGLAILANATKPAPPPPVNPNCWAFCKGG
jgi:hypothetical protein